MVETPYCIYVVEINRNPRVTINQLTLLWLASPSHLITLSEKVILPKFELERVCSRVENCDVQQNLYPCLVDLYHYSVSVLKPGNGGAIRLPPAPLSAFF